ncbi:hypothetical protein ACLOJK_032405 [Asimina triloba]
MHKRLEAPLCSLQLESKHKADKPMKAKIPNNGSEIFGYKENYNLVLRGFCGEMRLQEADGVLFDMGNQGITPDRDLSRALSFLYEMDSRGVKPNCIIMSFLIQSFCKMGAGFGSKFNYGSGFFQMKMKIPKGDCAGVVTTFYLSSNTDQHDELDFEFLGNREGKPYLLQTNVFANGVGNREQRIQPWFDPMFFVDDIPIRVSKNKTSNGVKYPSKPMQILSSLWDGEDWATDGGKEKTDWTQAPFIASYQGFSQLRTHIKHMLTHYRGSTAELPNRGEDRAGKRGCRCRRMEELSRHYRECAVVAGRWKIWSGGHCRRWQRVGKRGSGRPPVAAVGNGRAEGREADDAGEREGEGLEGRRGREQGEKSGAGEGEGGASSGEKKASEEWAGE